MLSGCGSGGGNAPDDGLVIVTVTLSRSGPPGPVFDQAPQSNIEVTVANSSGTWSDQTDEAGEARLSIPSGEYDVDISMCPDAPQHVIVSKGATARIRFDCLSP
jgi:hypothetical protein